MKLRGSLFVEGQPKVEVHQGEFYPRLDISNEVSIHFADMATLHRFALDLVLAVTDGGDLAHAILGTDWAHGR